MGGILTAAASACLAMGKGTVRACRDVYRMCKEGGYPVTNLQMAFTPINNLGDLSRMLLDSGFEVSDLGHQNIHFASNPISSERMFILSTEEGLAFVSDDKSLIQQSLRDYAAMEIGNTLKNMGYAVAVEVKGGEKVITAHDDGKNQVDIRIDKNTAVAKIDTRKTKRPKCDFVHQLIRQKIQAAPAKTAKKAKAKKCSRDIRIHLSRKNDCS